MRILSLPPNDKIRIHLVVNGTSKRINRLAALLGLCSLLQNCQTLDVHAHLQFSGILNDYTVCLMHLQHTQERRNCAKCTHVHTYVHSRGYIFPMHVYSLYRSKFTPVIFFCLCEIIAVHRIEEQHGIQRVGKPLEEGEDESSFICTRRNSESAATWLAETHRPFHLLPKLHGGSLCVRISSYRFLDEICQQLRNSHERTRVPFSSPLRFIRRSPRHAK